MSTALQQPEVIPPGDEIDAADLARMDPQFRDWVLRGQSIKLRGLELHKQTDEWKWSYGDWVCEGDLKHGEKHSQFAALGEGEGSRQTSMNIVSQCRRIPAENRRSDLSFEMHSPVTPCDPALQVLLLKEAAERGLKRDVLRELVKETRGILAPAEKSVTWMQKMTVAEEARVLKALKHKSWSKERALIEFADEALAYCGETED